MVNSVISDVSSKTFKDIHSHGLKMASFKMKMDDFALSMGRKIVATHELGPLCKVFNYKEAKYYLLLTIDQAKLKRSSYKR
jgi:hypothetical protein